MNAAARPKLGLTLMSSINMESLFGRHALSGFPGVHQAGTSEGRCYWLYRAGLGPVRALMGANCPTVRHNRTTNVWKHRGYCQDPRQRIAPIGPQSRADALQDWPAAGAVSVASGCDLLDDREVPWRNCVDQPNAVLG